MKRMEQVREEMGKNNRYSADIALERIRAAMAPATSKS